MANLNSNVTVSVSTSAPAVDATNFGTPMHAADGALLGAGFTERIRFYNTAAEIAADSDLDATAKAGATAALSQSPRVTQVAIGRVETGSFVAQVVTFTFTGTPEVGDDLTVTCNDIETTHTADSVVLNDEVGDLRTDLTAALAGEDVTVGGATNVITLTADNAGESFTYDSEVVLTGAGDLAVAEVLTTPNTGIGADLDAILAEDSDWYGYGIWSRDKGDILESALWCESNERLFVGQSSDAAVIAATAGNVLLRLGAFSYERTALIYHATDSEYADMAWLGMKLQADPDSTTTIWRYATLSGVAVDDLTATQIANVRDNDGNVYETFFGNNVTDLGVTVDGNPIDILITVDWTRARMEERIAQALVDYSNRNEKIPYTDAGIGVMIGIVKGVLDDGVAAEPPHFNTDDDSNGDPTPWARSPKSSDVPTADKTARLIRITFLAGLAGAIETASVSGSVVVDVSSA